MKSVSYVVLGGVGGEFPEQGTVADLLLAIPYLLSAKIIPPLHIVNDLLARGAKNAGMSGGCQWEPFQLNRSEWDELAHHLQSQPGHSRFQFVPPPEWVVTVEDWQSWIMMYKYGFPAEFRVLDRELRDLEQARKQAMIDGNQDLVEELHLRVIEAGNKLADLVMNHRRLAETRDNASSAE
jgi:hypothetical protein